MNSPLAAVEATAEAAAGLLLSAAALAVDTLAAVLSSADCAAEVIDRATHGERDDERDGGR
ncbi:hypothetical protein PHK61_28170 [Actinomycetospora lutea]|uniref:hypothetical protein n=1 Tax=Actinomycetospora lutea TaxID=663604 RepID=UPI0023650198|nr:hypothetical protein [Actinomycetospora lutea]MDD7942298.1 hypothetical protein [Actinomycetospora lutea]